MTKFLGCLLNRLLLLLLGVCALGSPMRGQTYPVYSTTAPQSHLFAQPVKTVLADFNGDGIADLATLGYQNGDTSSSLYLEIYLGAGDGTFATFPNAASTVDQCAVPKVLAAYGRDSSGSLNLALLCYDTLQIWHVSNDAGSTSSPLTLANAPSLRQVIPLDSGGASMAVGDFTGVGSPGVAVLEYGVNDNHARTIVVYPPLTCTVGGTCSGSSTFIPLSTQTLTIDTTGLVGDNDIGRAIVAIATPPFAAPSLALATNILGTCGGTLISFFYSGGIFVLGDINPIPPGYCVNAMAAGDLDNDGYTDIVLGGEKISGGGFISVSTGNSDAVLSQPGASQYSDVPVAIGSDGMAIVDLNGDGLADLVIGAPLQEGASQREATVFTYFGNGDGTFGNLTTPGRDVSGSNPVGLARGVQSVGVGQMNLDGFPDILMVDLIGDGSGGGVGTVTPLPGSLIQTAQGRVTQTRTLLSTALYGPGGGGGEFKNGRKGAAKPYAFYGKDSVTLSATVNATSDPDTGLSDGYVQFFDETTQAYVGSAPLYSGTATLPLAVAGAHYFVACFDGIGIYSGSCSDPFLAVPAKKDPYVSIDVDPTNTPPNQPITFSVSVFGSGSTPTGSINFVDNNSGNTLASAQLDGNGNASVTVSTLPDGQYDVVAVYSGDGTYNTSTSVDIPLTVAIPLIPVNISLGASASVVHYPTTVTMNATLTAADNSVPTGSVQFQVGGTTLATVALVNGTASANVLPPVGNYVMQVVYLGDGLYAPAASNRLPLTVHGGLLQFVPDAAYTVAGIPSDDNHGSYGGDGGPALAARFHTPYGVSSDAAGNIYVADEQNNLIRKITPDGVINTVAGVQYTNSSYTTPRFSGDGGVATDAFLANPTDAVADPAGNIYIADYSNSVVRRVDAVSGVITTYAGVGSSDQSTFGYNGDSGPANTIWLSHPTQVALDVSGNLYIADSGNNLIRKVDTAGNMTVYAGHYYPIYGGDPGTGTPAQNINLTKPMGVAVDAAGNVYIADTGVNLIREVDPLGNITTIAGSSTYGSPGDGGPAVGANLNSPQGITVDLAQDVFFVDNLNNSIRKIDAVSRTISTVAGMTGSSGSNYYYFDPAGVPATTMTLVSPGGVAVDSTGSLLLTDSYNQTVLRSGPQGAVLFGPQASGTTSTPQTVTLYNAGDEAINFSATPFTVSGDYVVTPVTCNFNTALAPGASCTIAVAYQPSTTALTGSIVFGSSASGHPTIALTTNPNPSTSATLLETNTNTPFFGDDLVLFAQVSSSASGPPPSGSVSFYDVSTLLGSAPIGNGYSVIYTSTLSIGSHNLTAVYSGDGFYAPSTSDVSVITVQPYQTSTSVTSSNSTPAANTPVTLTATVTAVSATTPPSGGTVTFYAGTTVLGTSTLNSSQVATLTTSAIPAGSNSVTAAYSGQGSYGPFTSIAISVIVSEPTGGGGGGGGGTPGFDYIINSFGIPTQIRRGDSSNGLGVTVISLGNSGGTVALTCGTLPKYATCTFDPSTVNAAAGANTTVTWTITTTPSP